MITRQKKITEAEPLLLSFNHIPFFTNLQKFFPSMTTFLQLGVCMRCRSAYVPFDENRCVTVGSMASHLLRRWRTCH